MNNAPDIVQTMQLVVHAQGADILAVVKLHSVCFIFAEKIEFFTCDPEVDSFTNAST